MEEIIRTISDDIAWLAALPASVWISMALALLLLAATWGCFWLWRHLHETEERVHARLAQTQIKTWEPVANDLERNAFKSASVAQTSLVNHLVIMNAAVEAKVRAGEWRKALVMTRDFLSYAVHAMSAPYMDDGNLHSCADLVGDRLQQYPDLSAANGELPGDATSLLEDLLLSLDRASPGSRVLQVRALIGEVINKIDPDYIQASHDHAA
ncbi:MAG: hypothetical protein ACK58T_22540 [Phycisphaerae bacterium]